jgi:hypothetical protein
MKDFFKVIIIIAAIMFSMTIYSQEKEDEDKPDADHLKDAKIEETNQVKEKVKSDNEKTKSGKEKIYAKKGIVEIQGSVNFSYMGDSQFSNYSLNFNFNPGIHYFVVDGFHIGLVPAFGVSYRDFKGAYYGNAYYLPYKSTSVYLSPGLIIGYAFTLSPKSLYLDVSGLFHYNFSVYESSEYPTDSYYYFSSGLNLVLKYIIHNVSINTGLYYSNNFSELGIYNHSLGISLGFSVFF